MSHQHPHQNRNRPQLVTDQNTNGSQNLRSDYQELSSNSPLLQADSSPLEIPRENLKSLPLPDTSGSEKPESEAPELAIDAPLSGKNLKRAQSLSGYYGMAGMLVARGNLYDGVLIMKESENRATEVIRVAMQNPGLMKILDRMIEGNAYFNLAMGHGLMLVAILMNHGRIKMNEPLLAQFGLHPDQVLPQPPAQPEPVVPVKRTRVSRKQKVASGV
jgi:hypothetical protein